MCELGQAVRKPRRRPRVVRISINRVEEMTGRGVEFEEYDTPETRTENGIARTPHGGEGAWFKDSEGNLVGVVRALAG